MAPMDSLAIKAVQAALQGLRYGSIELVVHDGRIVQVERREKLRVPSEGSANNR